MVSVTPIHARRMTLANVTKGRVTKPTKNVVYGVHGVGKSSFAAKAPNTIFLGTEDGSSHLDVERFPAAQTWEDVLAAVGELLSQPHDYKSLALDTLDWAEPLLHKFICERDKEKSIEDYGGGFGKGIAVANKEWRTFLGLLDVLSERRNMHINLIAHANLRQVALPDVPEKFDRYELALNPKSAKIICEWAQNILFARYVDVTVTLKNKRILGASDGSRVICTNRTAAYEAKNRFNLPDRMPLSWDDFFAAVQADGQSADTLRTEVLDKAAQLGGDIAAKIKAEVDKADSVARLQYLNNLANIRLAERANPAQENKQ